MVSYVKHRGFWEKRPFGLIQLKQLFSSADPSILPLTSSNNNDVDLKVEVLKWLVQMKIEKCIQSQSGDIHPLYSCCKMMYIQSLMFLYWLYCIPSLTFALTLLLSQHHLGILWCVLQVPNPSLLLLQHRARLAVALSETTLVPLLFDCVEGESNRCWVAGLAGSWIGL